jgi:hypothetical protein
VRRARSTWLSLSPKNPHSDEYCAQRMTCGAAAKVAHLMYRCSCSSSRFLFFFVADVGLFLAVPDHPSSEPHVKTQKSTIPRIWLVSFRYEKSPEILGSHSVFHGCNVEFEFSCSHMLAREFNLNIGWPFLRLKDVVCTDNVPYANAKRTAEGRTASVRLLPVPKDGRRYPMRIVGISPANRVEVHIDGCRYR